MKWVRAFAVLIAVIAVLALLVAGPGTRAGVWHFRFGFSLLRYAAYFGIAAVVLALVALAGTRPRGAGLVVLLVALVLGAAAFLVPWSLERNAKDKPPIHDITTDTEDPPTFVTVLPLREDAVNPATYGGDSVAEQQSRAYPDIRPLELDVAPSVAFGRGLDSSREMDWAIHAAEPADGRIEATATTTWFGFKDDVVVRVRPDGDGSRIDVRSVSRAGAAYGVAALGCQPAQLVKGRTDQLLPYVVIPPPAPERGARRQPSRGSSPASSCPRPGPALAVYRVDQLVEGPGERIHPLLSELNVAVARLEPATDELVVLS
ncbi:MAG: DUF1499 domain-containing protein [Candidatus Limnocylindria bacterium]